MLRAGYAPSTARQPKQTFNRENGSIDLAIEARLAPQTLRGLKPQALRRIADGLDSKSESIAVQTGLAVVKLSAEVEEPEVDTGLLSPQEWHHARALTLAAMLHGARLASRLGPRAAEILAELLAGDDAMLPPETVSRDSRSRRSVKRLLVLAAGERATRPGR